MRGPLRNTSIRNFGVLPLIGGLGCRLGGAGYAVRVIFVYEGLNEGNVRVDTAERMVALAGGLTNRRLTNAELTARR